MVFKEKSVPLSQKCEEFFELLKHDFFTLRVEWRFYRNLFGTNPETVDLLNKISGSSANTIDRVFFERTLLGLRKLTDPAQAKRGKSSSVSVKGLLQFPELQDQDLKRLVSQAEKACGFARDWSNRRIAHSDLEYRNGDKPLKTASRQKVEDAMTAISLPIRWVGTHRLDLHLCTHPIPSVRDESSLLIALYEGQKVIEKRAREKAKFLEEKEYEKLTELRKEERNYPEWLIREDPELD